MLIEKQSGPRAPSVPFIAIVSTPCRAAIGVPGIDVFAYVIDVFPVPAAEAFPVDCLPRLATLDPTPASLADFEAVGQSGAAQAGIADVVHIELKRAVAAGAARAGLE
jgi:hypothetical protein